MTRQRLTWMVIGLVVVGLLGVRGLVGQGLGRVYVERVEVSVAPGAGAASEPWRAVPAAEASRSWTTWKRVPPKAFGAALAADPEQDRVQLSWPRTIGLWLAAFFTLAIFSFLYADNVLYKLAESVVVGVSAAYWMTLGFWDTLVPKLGGAIVPDLVRTWVQPSLRDVDVQQQVSMWVAMVLGVMLLTRLAPRGGWIAAWPLAFIVGVTAGLKIVSHVESDLMAQAVATMQPVVKVVETADGGVSAWSTTWASLPGVLVLVGVICSLAYFLFSVQHRGVVGGAARVGVWYLMITFGAAFGMTVMGRIALLAARCEFLLDDWLWLIDPNNMRA